MQQQSRLIAAHSQKMQKINDLLSMTTALGNHYRAYHINPDKGCGKSDLYDFGRLCLGRGNFCFNKNTQLYCNMPFSLGVTIFLSGSCDFVQRQSGEKFHVTPPQILLRKGEFGPTDVYLSAHTPLCTLSLDFNTDLLEKIHHTANSNKITAFFSDIHSPGILLLEDYDSRFICLAQYLSGIAQANNEFDLITIEGQALSLLSALFSLSSERQDKYYQKIQHVITILQSHYHEKITIPELARQAGINECYLKRYFKAYTGLTISTFLEKYRMELALMLFSQGKPAHAVAHETGYNDLYYFREVFKKHFHYFPDH